MSKELAEQYENEMFDFEQLSASLVSRINVLLNCISALYTVIPQLHLYTERRSQIQNLQDNF